MPRLSNLWLVMIVLTQGASAQVGDAGLRTAAFGGGGSALIDSHWQLLNPASLGNVEASNVSLFATQGFGFADLRFGRTTFSMPLRRFGVGIDASTFGNEQFRFVDAGLTVARPVFARTGTYLAGARTSYRIIGIDGFDRAFVVILDVGWIAEIRPGLSLGGTIGNIFEARFTELDRIPRSMRVGAAIEPKSGLQLVVDISKEERWPASVHIGVEYVALSVLALRAGSATNPERMSGGVRLAISDLVIDLLADRHVDLGWTPGLGVSISW